MHRFHAGSDVVSFEIVDVLLDSATDKESLLLEVSKSFSELIYRMGPSQNTFIRYIILEDEHLEV